MIEIFDSQTLETLINEAWDKREGIKAREDTPYRRAVLQVLNDLDGGQRRVCEKRDGAWHTHQWIKKAILLSFKMQENARIAGGPGGGPWFDKVPSKFQHWNEDRFREAGFRAVPGCFVRHSAFIAPGAVLMPSFINVGAYVGEGTMVDIFATIASCAQIGRHCHISSGVCIGGVLEPLQANPVIIEDHCFIGAGSQVVEEVLVEEGAVLSGGVFVSASTKIIDRESGEVFYGRIPPYSVVVPGTLPATKPLKDGSPAPGLACAVIVKRVDEKTRAKTSVNALLRDV